MQESPSFCLFLFLSSKKRTEKGSFLRTREEKNTHLVSGRQQREKCFAKKEKKKQHEYANRNEKSGFESSLLVYTFGVYPSSTSQKHPMKIIISIISSIFQARFSRKTKL